MDKFFPYKSYAVKSTDDPWVSQHYKKESRKRRREYKLHGKSERYQKLKRENEEELAEAKKNFYNIECEKITSGTRVVSFNAIKNVNTPSRPKPWQPTDMYQGLEETEMLEDMATFYNKISAEFEDLKPTDKPVTFDRDIFHISSARIIDRVQKMKKPRSMVPGDVPPRLMLVS